ncbi:MAG: LysR family transcriptional regulator [Candidatus Thiodiazotropha sp.]
MSEQPNNPLDLSGRLLQLLVVVVEEGSITKAAERLGVTQSAVSHLLDKLRGLLDDPLFVKSGRGIVATERAEHLAQEARVLLEEMRRFTRIEEFDPARLQTTYTIAANDFQRDLLLPRLFERLYAQAPGLSLRVINSGVPTVEMLRDEQCQLVISPRPPDAGDILQKRLFENAYHVFYDGTCREAPRNLDEYRSAEHITVTYDPPRQLDIDQLLASRGIERRFRVRVPGIAAIAPFLRGSRMLTTLPGLLESSLLHGFESSPLPIDCPPMPMYMIWHMRYRHDPVHNWVRTELEKVVEEVLSV